VNATETAPIQRWIARTSRENGNRATLRLTSQYSERDENLLVEILFEDTTASDPDLRDMQHYSHSVKTDKLVFSTCWPPLCGPIGSFVAEIAKRYSRADTVEIWPVDECPAGMADGWIWETPF